LDPACNPDAILTLRRCFQTAGRGKPVHVLFASKQESNISVMLPYLADACADITLTSFEHPSARTEMDYALFTEDHRYIENPLFALMTLQMEHPEFNANFDMDKEKAAASRKRLLDYARENHLVMAGMHLPEPAFISME
jgi:folylpolyglutamate synthase/dihydropteroate synthase